jgi:hypothetical protein
VGGNVPFVERPAVIIQREVKSKKAKGKSEEEGRAVTASFFDFRPSFAFRLFTFDLV